MLDINYVIDRLSTLTGYAVEPARAKEPNLQEPGELPIIYVGYASIESKDPNAPIEYDLFNQYGEDLVQTFDIQIVCSASTLPVIWKKVYTVLIGHTPTVTLSSTSSASGFTYAQGGVMGIVNTNLWWIDRWRIGFPTTNVDFTAWTL